MARTGEPRRPERREHERRQPDRRDTDRGDGPRPAGGEHVAPAAAGAPETVGVRHGTGSRARQYLVSRRDAIGPQSFGAPLGASIGGMFGGFTPYAAGPAAAGSDFDAVVQQLHADPEVDVVRTMQPRTFSVMANTPTSLQRVVVAQMTPAKADQVAQVPSVLVEEDHELTLAPVGPPAGIRDMHDPTVLMPFGVSIEWSLKIVGQGGEPVRGAAVYLYGSAVPVQGVTDERGQLTLTLLNESQRQPRALYVNPKSDYWSLWIDRPDFVDGETNTVVVQPLAATFAEFPARQAVGWGERAMRLDQIPPDHRGTGTKVAIIDSGAAARHPDLTRVRTGSDLTADPADPRTWSTDVIAHGSHCAGIIAGADDTTGIRGFAPDAEVHALKIFPGGRFSSLLDALDYCVEQDIDVVNMSLGSGEASQLVLQKLAQLKQQGIACIVAAGNSGDAVQFPGSSPDVLTVAAIGKINEFPESSFHSQQVWAPNGGTPPTTQDGYFSAKFTCHGPEVDVCAPGVAILSSVPEKGFAAWDGTSMAAPHITGLAALVLAHHPDFTQPELRARTSARVDRLFQIIKASATPVALGDTTRTGAGLPDAPRALGLDVAPPNAIQLVQQMLADLNAAMAQAGLA